jgi:hypothetical protein
MIPIATLRQAAPKHITARELIRRHLHEAGKRLNDLATTWDCQPFSVWRVFQRTERPLCPHHIEGVIAYLQLDEFDANELRLRGAREAGWDIDPRMILEGA